MGFMDKAKKLAEQAQEKLDEAQKQFNSGGSTAGQTTEAPPAGEAAPPSGQPPEDARTPAREPSTDSGANASPDPFKPIQ